MPKKAKKNKKTIAVIEKTVQLRMKKDTYPTHNEDIPV